MVPFEKQIEYIIANFNFEHVLKMMKWKYSRCNYGDNGEVVGYYRWMIYNGYECSIPSMGFLVMYAMKLLKEVATKYEDEQENALLEDREPQQYFMTECGPFRVIAYEGYLELLTVFESFRYEKD